MPKTCTAALPWQSKNSSSLPDSDSRTMLSIRQLASWTSKLLAELGECIVAGVFLRAFGTSIFGCTLHMQCWIFRYISSSKFELKCRKIFCDFRLLTQNVLKIAIVKQFDAPQVKGFFAERFRELRFRRFIKTNFMNATICNLIVDNIQFFHVKNLIFNWKNIEICCQKYFLLLW